MVLVAGVPVVGVVRLGFERASLIVCVLAEVLLLPKVVLQIGSGLLLVINCWEFVHRAVAFVRSVVLSVCLAPTILSVPKYKSL